MKDELKSPTAIATIVAAVVAVAALGLTVLQFMKDDSDTARVGM